MPAEGDVPGVGCAAHQCCPLQTARSGKIAAGFRRHTYRPCRSVADGPHHQPVTRLEFGAEPFAQSVSLDVLAPHVQACGRAAKIGRVVYAVCPCRERPGRSSGKIRGPNEKGPEPLSYRAFRAALPHTATRYAIVGHCLSIPPESRVSFLAIAPKHFPGRFLAGAVHCPRHLALR